MTAIGQASARAPSRRLPDLVPGVYRQRDAGQPGAPMAALIATLGEGLDELYRAISALWDDHFVERADADALPLLAELFGARLVTSDPAAQRALLARIVGWRRRKGTLATLEEALGFTSGWDVEADEGFRSMLVAIDFRHLATWRGRTAILWDPIGVADPLTRRALDERRPRSDELRRRGPLVEVLPGEAVDDTLRRLGRVDAGRHAASPRMVDLRGWVRSDAVVLRSSPMRVVELERVVAGVPVALATGRGVHVDPLGRDTPLVWLAPLTPPDLIPSQTARHETAPDDESPRVAARMLTPTALAGDPDRAEAAGAITVAVEGVPLIGPPAPRAAVGAMTAGPVAARPVLRLSEDERPSPGDVWRVEVLAASDDGGANDIALMSAELGDRGPGPITVGRDATLPISGHSVELVITRVAGKPRARSAAGAWSDLDVDPPMGPATSNAAVVTSGQAARVVRFERDLARQVNRITGFVVGPGARWAELARPGAPLDRADGIAVAGDGADLLAVTAVDDRLTAWRIALGAAPAIARLDTAAGPAPVARRSPAVCVHGGRLYIHGGDLSDAAAGDVWSLPLAGGAWQAHPIRRQQERIGATLLSTEHGVVMVGGDEVPGAMQTGVFAWDPATARAWRPMPALPFEPGRPGLVAARATAAGIEVIAWADRTRPQHLVLPSGADAWQLDDNVAPNVESIEAREPGGAPTGSSPPGAGEAVFAGDRLLVIAPPPLPASELVLVLGGAGRIAFLPRLDLPIGRSLRLRIASDGGSYERELPGTVARPRALDARFGGAFASEFLRAPGGDRISAPGRLSRRPWRLRQANLAVWDSPRFSAGRGDVLVDPRLGRIALPGDAPAGVVSVSTRIGRPGAIGAGCLPAGGRLPAAWNEPGIAPWPALDLDRDPDAYVEADRAGISVRGPEGQLIAVTADLPGAVAVAGARPGVGEPPRLALLQSGAIPPARLTSGVDRGATIYAADPSAMPRIDADPERRVSLALHAEQIAVAPHFVLAGLWLPGRLELIIPSGEVELRFCHVGQPGEVALWIPGAGTQDLAARRSLPAREIEVRLYGCALGVVEVPPWVHLIAAGCTFDAGDRAKVALRAAGARVTLRHCTVYGTTEAGELSASSCVHAGPVRVDRRDLGFVRYSLIARGGAPPTLYASRIHTAGFVSQRPTDPGYLALGASNGDALGAGEDGALPGAYAERGDHARELAARTDEFLPIGMVPFHVDRTTNDLHRLSEDDRHPPR